MSSILAGENEVLLQKLASTEALLAFDFDGTLAPIVSERDEANMRASTGRLFAELCALYPCAVISGRSRNDVKVRLGGADVAFVIGNHGLEPGTDLSTFAGEIGRVKPLLEAALAGFDGVDIEDKGYSLAIHYRRALQKRAARTTIARAVVSLGGTMRVVPGKLVANVVPASASNKGDALLGLMAHLGVKAALYVGDDVTDEDVFRIKSPSYLLTTRIGPSRRTAARYTLRDQREIDQLLLRLIALRSPRPRRAALAE
jgi:trehalose 6-phosphate phosphatase